MSPRNFQKESENRKLRRIRVAPDPSQPRTVGTSVSQSRHREVRGVPAVGKAPPLLPAPAAVVVTAYRRVCFCTVCTALAADQEGQFHEFGGQKTHEEITMPRVPGTKPDGTRNAQFRVSSAQHRQKVYTLVFDLATAFSPNFSVKKQSSCAPTRNMF